MAGSHQIWTLNLDTNVVQATVGTGAESIVDGPPEEAALAQPSGIAADAEGVLYFADSETSSVRFADTTTMHEVRTLVGSGLFDFGDADGDGGASQDGGEFPLAAGSGSLPARLLHRMGGVEHHRASGLGHDRQRAHVRHQGVVAKAGAPFTDHDV